LHWAQLGDTHHPITEAEVVEQFGLGWDEGDDALGLLRDLNGAVHLVETVHAGLVVNTKQENREQHRKNYDYDADYQITPIEVVLFLLATTFAESFAGQSPTQ